MTCGTFFTHKLKRPNNANPLANRGATRLHNGLHKVTCLKQMRRVLRITLQLWSGSCQLPPERGRSRCVIHLASTRTHHSSAGRRAARPRQNILELLHLTTTHSHLGPHHSHLRPELMSSVFRELCECIYKLQAAALSSAYF